MGVPPRDPAGVAAKRPLLHFGKLDQCLAAVLTDAFVFSGGCLAVPAAERLDRVHGDAQSVRDLTVWFAALTAFQDVLFLQCCHK
jgi:hypothetical protein